MSHIPVLLNEIIDHLHLEAGDIVVDGTLGEGGHSQKICEFIGQTGTLVGIDMDSTAIARAKKKLAECEAKQILIKGNFRQLDELISSAGIGKVSAVLLDLGVNSSQLDDDERGFTFRTDKPLIMTLDDSPDEEKTTAYDVVNSWEEKNLADIIYGFGEERLSRQIAKAICQARQKAPIKTTAQLVSIIENAVPAWYRKGKIHPATRTFQAIRIAVNDELGALADGLESAWRSLDKGGRLAVISFHSLEARIVKNFFKDKKDSGEGELVTKRVVKPTREETLSNPRSRSAQLRVITKII